MAVSVYSGSSEGVRWRLPLAAVYGVRMAVGLQSASGWLVFNKVYKAKYTAF
jgi:hypothetical protein